MSDPIPDFDDGSAALQAALIPKKTFEKAVCRGSNGACVTMFGSDFYKNDIAELAEVLAENPEINGIDFSAIDFKDGSLSDFTTLLASSENITEISLTAMPFESKGISLLAKAFAMMPQLEKIKLHANKITAEQAKEIAEALADNRSLVSLRLAANDTSPEFHAALDEFNTRPHPNLFSITPFSESRVAITSARLTVLHEAIKELAENPENPSTMKAVAALHERRPMLRYSAAKEATIQTQALDLMDALEADRPFLAEDDAVNLAALTHSEDGKFTPLDNPQTWRNHPNLLRELKTQGELTAETLATTLPSGYTLAEYALAYGAPETTIAFLNDAGMFFNQAEDFVDLTKRFAIDTLFSTKNWSQGSTEDFNEVVSSLQPEQQEQISNSHALNVAIQGNETRRQQTRGRS